MPTFKSRVKERRGDPRSQDIALHDLGTSCSSTLSDVGSSRVDDDGKGLSGGSGEDGAVRQLSRVDLRLGRQRESAGKRARRRRTHCSRDDVVLQYGGYIRRREVLDEGRRREERHVVGSTVEQVEISSGEGRKEEQNYKIVRRGLVLIVVLRRATSEALPELRAATRVVTFAAFRVIVGRVGILQDKRYHHQRGTKRSKLGQENYRWEGGKK